METVSGQANGIQIAAQDFGVAVDVLDANGVDGAAAEALEAERPGAGKEFEHARVSDLLPKAIEQGLAHKVGRGTNALPSGDLEQSPAHDAANDAHETIVESGAGVCPVRVLARLSAGDGDARLEPPQVEVVWRGNV